MMTKNILTLGISKDEIKHIALDREKNLFTARTIRDVELALDVEDEIDTILLDSHFSKCIEKELRTILGLTPPTTQIVLHYHAEDKLDLDRLRQLGIKLIQVPLIE